MKHKIDGVGHDCVDGARRNREETSVGDRAEAETAREKAQERGNCRVEMEIPEGL